MGATDDARAARAEAVSDAVGRIRGIEAARGVTRPALEAIREELMLLARREHLFPSAEFPPPRDGEKGSNRYLLHEDPGDRFALSLVASNPGSEIRPHDHTIWAVVVAVEGQELNRVHERLDDGADPGRCSVRLREEVMVEPGRGICLLPEDIHSVHTTGAAPTRHLHMYGLAPERLDDRRAYDMESGQVIQYNRNFMQPAAAPSDKA